MAKDPAFLFYDADASRDVSHLNRLERGCYFDLIQAQRKFGRLNIDLIKKILGKDFDTCWESIKICLTCDEDMYFIDWLENSIFKRKMYSTSRSKNRTSSKSTTNEKTYDNHKEIANVIVNNTTHVFNTKPKSSDFNGLPEAYLQKSIELIKFTKQVDVSSDIIIGVWEVFKVQKLTGDTYYANEGKVYSHFMDWLKFQKFDNGTVKQADGTTRFNAGALELLRKGKEKFAAYTREQDGGT